jgi:hypothetical protein
MPTAATVEFEPPDVFPVVPDRTFWRQYVREARRDVRIVRPTDPELSAPASGTASGTNQLPEQKG